MHLERLAKSPVLFQFVTLEDSMNCAYDIFRKDLLGTPVWMESAQDLDTAKVRMAELTQRSPGEYFVASQETREIVCETPSRYFDWMVKGSVRELLI
jgi:hypothetical protein